MATVKRVQRPADIIYSVSPQPIPDDAGEQPGERPVETTTGS
jgi:hypothetical protein